ncbi:hypothetical protein KORDIASMS9_01628 [Kordia sp. SMS9]|uniref:hypothetical protein n=1 Tax=Kordia sp. SMS9 TaxID=2282170 RepID=UPI000E0CFC7B|nr:hypothetical protein [Kordia sp. SMS9]AXG69406.1 hypothetical protein KORDIASMS9_01628 [Kordia sp. SMS9]
MKKYFILFLTVVLFLVSCSSKSTDVVSSTLHFKKGFTQTLVFSTKTSANKMGSFEDANEVHFQLDEITSDSMYLFTGKVTRMQYESDIFGEKESLDTEVIKALNSTKRLSETELEMYNDIKYYIDEEFTFTLDKYGNIIEKAKFTNASPMADQTIVAQYTPIPTFSFPTEKLAVGTTWNYETSNPLIETQKMKFTYTIDDITEDKIFIDVNLEIDGLAGMLKKTTATGIYEIDRKTKRFIKGDRMMNLQTGGGKVTYTINER